MTDIGQAKTLLRAHYTALDAATGADITAVLESRAAPDLLWRGFHPFNEIVGASEVARRFWIPLGESLRHLQRRQDIFIAGKNQIDGGRSTWVVSMGHLMGLFDAPWLGIRPTRKMAFLRYCEFSRVASGKIAETAMFFDIPHFMAQAGQNPFPPQTGAHMVQPGPMTHDGLLYESQDPREGKRTLAAITRMIGDIATWRKEDEMPLVEELRHSWHEDMIWWGPAGIGATYTIKRYAEQHAGPFRAAFSSRRFHGHVCFIAEGHFGGFFGWPNLTLSHDGGFMGMPGTGQTGDMRVIDMYRRDGDRLSENWIFIDLLHFWRQQGVDILERATGIKG